MTLSGKEVLMLVSSFPPGPQTIFRTLQFARYLPEFGWTPLILTATQDSGPGASATRAPESVPVFRAARVPTPSMVVRRWRTKPSVSTVVESTTQQAPRSKRFIVRAARQLLLWFDTPDAFVGWLPVALWRGLRLVRRMRPVAIHASGPPFSVVLAGAIVAWMTRLPLVADFRDAWTLDPMDPFGTLGGEFVARRSGMRTRLLRALERWCLSEASTVLFTSMATRGLYREAYPEHAHRMHVIYNGAAPEDFAGDVAPFDKPTIAHVGTLHDYQQAQVECFLHAFAAACHAGTLPAGTRSAFVGSVSSILRVKLHETLEELRLTDSVEFHGPVPHAVAIGWMRRSHCLLLFVGTNPYVRLSKISEYVAAGTPFLAFAPAESETGQETLRYGGIVVDTSVGEATQALAELMSRKEVARGHAFLAEPHPLSRRTEASELARLLDAVCERC